MCRGKLVKIMEPTREYTTPTTSLCFIAHLSVVAVVAVHLPLLFPFAVAATARFNGCIIFPFFAFWHLQWNWILLPPLHFSHASLCLPFSTTTFYVKGVPLVQCTLLEIDKFCSALYSIVYFLFYHCFVLIAWKLHKLHGMRIVTLPHFIWGIMPELSLPAAQWSKTA